jgi:hypothetical protein
MFCPHEYIRIRIEKYGQITHFEPLEVIPVGTAPAREAIMFAFRQDNLAITTFRY